MANISDLIRGHRELDVVIRADAGDESSEVMGIIKIEYNPRAITPEVERAMMDIQKNGGQGVGAAAASLVACCVTAWDLTRTNPETEREEPIPITREAMDGLGIAVLVPMLIGIGADMNPKSRGASGQADAPKTPAPPRSISASTKG